MTRINTNVPSMIARQNLNRSGEDLQVRLTRLSTGLRINRGSDDPAGLIVSERLGTELKGIEQAVSNSERASSLIATTEGALAEINDMLNSIKSLVVEAGNSGAISDEERDANQLQIDSALQSITRIANTASFGGQKLVDGSLDYTTSNVSISTIINADITGASFVGSNSIDVNVDVLASAQKGALYLTGDNSALPGPPPDGELVSSLTIQVRGVEGVRELEFVSGVTYTEIMDSINSLTDVTGVTARLINGNANSGIVFESEDYGADSFVSVERIDKPLDPADDNFNLFKLANNEDANHANPFNPAGPPPPAPTLVSASRDDGRDVQALINGNLATGDGLEVSIGTPTLSLSLDLAESYATDPTLAVDTFQITGGGSLFQLGPEVTSLQQSNIGVQSVSSEELGKSLQNGAINSLASLQSGKINSLANAESRRDFTPLSEILEKAIDEVSILRGRLGAFERNVLDPNRRSLQSAFENLTASRSQIRDADFAAETSALTRAQILQSSGTTVLQQANTQSQQVLQLLG